jgi:integrase
VEHGELAKSTYDNYRSRWNRHVCPAFGDVPVTDITPLAIQGWVLDLTKAMGSMSLALMSQVLDLCVRYGVLESNPAANRFRMPRRQERGRARDVWDVESMGAALSAAKGSLAYLPAVLCGVASCRVGESLGARVDLGEVREARCEGMTLAVVDVVRQVGRDGHVSEALKTKQSRRPVVVPEPWSLDVLAEEGPWLCGGVFGPLSQWVVNRSWESALKDAGVPPIPMANLRSSWRTYMRWELGVPEDMLEKMMGHAGRGVGERHYDRPEEDAFVRAVASAWAAFRDR